MIEIPKKVYEQLEAIRTSGLTNMFDYHRVQVIANEREYYDLVIWIEDQVERRSYGMRLLPGNTYSKGMFEGFAPIKEDE